MQRKIENIRKRKKLDFIDEIVARRILKKTIKSNI